MRPAGHQHCGDCATCSPGTGCNARRVRTGWMQIADCKIAVFQERNKLASPQIADCRVQAFNFRFRPLAGNCALPQTAESARKGADFRVQPFCGNLKPAADYPGCRFQITAFRNGWQNTCNLFKTDYKFFRVQVFCQQIESAPLHCHLTQA